ncbi:MAG: transcription termination/antitermination factor NusG [Oscillospiraceae bacterium]|nr:transcription termination/antitermination factor NusG [Oscillospiraceae bacterium]
MASESRWYIIHTYSGYENKVAENIGKIVENRKMQDKILGVNIPIEKVVEVRDDKTVEVERKIFPGYVVVKLAVEYSDKEGEENVLKVPDETWHAIRYTRGVTGFVGPDGKPVPLTAEEVKKLGIEDENDNAELSNRTVTEVSYEVGDLVTICDGLMEGNSGVVEVIDTENNTVRVIVSFMGKEAPVELPLNQVKKAID